MRREIVVIFLYFFITALTTYPLIFKFATHVAHDPPNDAFYCMWCLWWSKTALFDLHTNPLFTNLHFYPYGTSIIFGTQIHGTGLLASPLQLIFQGLQGLIIEYSIIVFVSLIVSAYGAYLLTAYVCGHRGAAFVAGIIYAFPPVRMFNMVRLQYFSIQWIPLFALFFIKTLREDKKRNPILAAVFFSLIMFDYLGYSLDMVFLGVLTVIFVPLFAKKIGLAALSRRLALFVLTATVLTLPYTVMIAKEIRGNPNVYSQATMGITLKCLVSPPSNSTMYNALYNTVEDQPDFVQKRNQLEEGFILSILSSTKNQPFIRYSVIALLLYSMYIVLRYRRSTAYWIIIAAFFCLMSFGPRYVLWGAYSLDIPTLYSLLSIIVPPLRMARTTGEHVFHFTLAIAVICSVGLAVLLDGITTGAKRIALTVAVSTVILAESLVIPLDLIEPEVSMAYEMINADQDDFTILELPIDDVMFLSRQFLYQTYHKKKLLNGLSVRVSDETQRIMESPFVSGVNNPAAFLQMPLSSRNKILDENKNFFKLTELKYVIVNGLTYRVFAAEFQISPHDLERYLILNGFKKVFEDKQETVFRRAD